MTQFTRWLVGFGVVLVLAACVPAFVVGETSPGRLAGLACCAGIGLGGVALLPAGIRSMAVAGRSPARSFAVQAVTVVVMVPVFVLIANFLYHSDALDVVSFGVWTLPPLVAILALYAWVNGFTQRRGHYLATRIAALDREIGRVRRAQAVAGELVAAQRQE